MFWQFALCISPFVFNTHKFPQSQISICKWRILPGSAAWLFSMLLEGGESAYHFLQMKLNCLPGSQSVRLSVSLSVPLFISLSFCPPCCPCSSSDWFSSAVQFSNQPVEALWCFAELETRQKLRASENVSRFWLTSPSPFSTPTCAFMNIPADAKISQVLLCFSIRCGRGGFLNAKCNDCFKPTKASTATTCRATA